MTIDKSEIEKKEKHAFGFPKPTIIIDAQSTAPLVGIEVEQRFYRMYLMGTGKDVAVFNYPVNQVYWQQYLQDMLHLDLPKVLQIPNAQQGTLSLDILSQGMVLNQLKGLVSEGYKAQFFNLAEGEVALAHELGNPTYAQNIDTVMQIGTKTGFREFCGEYGIPMPDGYICNSAYELAQAVLSIMQQGSEVIIKASAGTGGTELGSNISISKEEVIQAGNKVMLKELLLEKVSKLQPSEPPYVVEAKLHREEASLHIFLDEQGKIQYGPMFFGQLTHEGSYVGGFYPNTCPPEFNSKVEGIANEKIIPALQANGATGMHCMDFLHNCGTEGGDDIKFIEDNTRPGALDFIHHFVVRVVEKVDPKNEQFSWYHRNTSLQEIGWDNVTAQQILAAGGELFDPTSSFAKQNGWFALLSNPDVLPYGYSAHLTVVSLEKRSSQETEQLHALAVTMIKNGH